jgi:hypothetical protein
MEALQKHLPSERWEPFAWFSLAILGRPGVQMALAAAVLVLVAATGWLARDLARSRSTAASAQAGLAREQTARAQAERDLAAARTARAPLVVSVLLSPGLTRGSGDAGRISFASDADVLRLQLDTAKLTPGSYRATLRTAEGDVIWSGRASRGAADSLVSVDIPARLLTTHDYEMALNDSSPAPAASYALSVVRR